MQTRKSVLYPPVLPLVICTSQVPVQVSQCLSTQGMDAPSLVPSLENQQGVLQKSQLSPYAMHCGQLTYTSISLAAQRECSYIEALPSL